MALRGMMIPQENSAALKYLGGMLATGAAVLAVSGGVYVACPDGVGAIPVLSGSILISTVVSNHYDCRQLLGHPALSTSYCCAIGVQHEELLNTVPVSQVLLALFQKLSPLKTSSTLLWGFFVVCSLAGLLLGEGMSANRRCDLFIAAPSAFSHSLILSHSRSGKEPQHV